MTINEYQQLAMRTCNKELSQQGMLVNSVMGLCGESGEASEVIKKHLFHHHELNKEEFIKELGDVCWYLAEAASAIDVSLEQIMQSNIDKLKARYPDGFSIEGTYHS